MGELGRAVYRTGAWRRLRTRRLALAGWRCENPACGRRVHLRAGGLSDACAELHHVVPLEAGGAAIPDLEGIRVLCRACHLARHGKRARDRSGPAWDDQRRILAATRRGDM